MPGGHERAGSDRHRQGPDRAGRHPQQDPLGANAILGASLACAKAAAESPGHHPVQLYRRRQRQDPARAHDEHPQRRRPRHQQRGDPGVHDHARGRLLLPRGPAHVRRGVPHAEERPEGERHPRRRRGRRGRLRPQPEEGRGRPEGHRQGHRGGRLQARRGLHDRHRRRLLRVVERGGEVLYPAQVRQEA